MSGSSRCGNSEGSTLPTEAVTVSPHPHALQPVTRFREEAS